MSVLLFGIGTLAAGAGLMYVFDPDRGRARRARLRDRSHRMARELKESFGSAVADARNRANGIAASAREGSAGDALDAARQALPGQAADGGHRGAAPSVRLLATAGALGLSTVGIFAGGAWRVIGTLVGGAIAERLLVHPRTTLQGPRVAQKHT